jgi:hypothetical protein
MNGTRLLIERRTSERLFLPDLFVLFDFIHCFLHPCCCSLQYSKMFVSSVMVAEKCKSLMWKLQPAVETNDTRSTVVENLDRIVMPA